MTEDRWPVGTEVIVLTLGRKRGVITSTTTNGRYQVQVGSLAIICRPEDLDRPEPERKTRKPRAERDVPEPAPARAVARVDLHGLSVEDAMTTVLKAIDTAILEGADRLEVVHGKGTGRLKAAVQRGLRGLPSVRSVREDPVNAGVTWIFF
jgi:DNA mismatch repair protein MutS2